MVPARRDALRFFMLDRLRACNESLRYAHTSHSCMGILFSLPLAHSTILCAMSCASRYRSALRAHAPPFVLHDFNNVAVAVSPFRVATAAAAAAAADGRGAGMAQCDELFSTGRCRLWLV